MGSVDRLKLRLKQLFKALRGVNDTEVRIFKRLNPEIETMFENSFQTGSYNTVCAVDYFHDKIEK